MSVYLSFEFTIYSPSKINLLLLLEQISKRYADDRLGKSSFSDAKTLPKS